MIQYDILQRKTNETERRMQVEKVFAKSTLIKCLHVFHQLAKMRK